MIILSILHMISRIRDQGSILHRLNLDKQKVCIMAKHLLLEYAFLFIIADGGFQVLEFMR